MSPRTDLDPTTLAVLKGSLEQITDEMDSAYATAAFSPIISDALDRASGIYDGASGEVIAQGSTGLPIFIGVMQFTVQAVTSILDLEPGDVCIVNDPFTGGTHLMDVKLVAPYHGPDGEVLFYLANTGHWPDIGGMSPGGITSTATETYQEGVRVPPMLLCRGGVVNEELIELLLANIRGKPSDRRGDLAAQLAALRLGAGRLDELVNRFGVDLLRAAVGEMNQRAEALMRERIRAIPDGTYSAIDYMDNDGITDEPFAVDLDIVVSDGTMTFDFSRCREEVDGPMNCPISSTMTACLIGLKHIFPDIPVNGGCLRPLEFRVPEGSFLNPTFPKPVAACTTEAPQRIIDNIFTALADVVPNPVPAPCFSTGSLHAITGRDAEGYTFTFFASTGGGYGGSVRHDGLINGATTISVALTPGLELQEQRFPLRYRRYAIRENSEGPGVHRGGPGTEISIEFLADRGKVSVMGDRAKFGAPGAKGGGSGAPADHSLVLGGVEWRPPMGAKAENVPLRRGDVLHLRTPGGGGWGPAQDRDRAAVGRDIERGYITAARARTEYGLM
ncbi:hydantoinase B/oxoprolinase family protein [Nocardia sp. NPDC059239]|uniref:hydantoinase B/oxoprolinase family protein n=1 Tax=Nocardia sp. NPDC059239 TaxID=3346785 RepID=UPI0036C0F7C8